ASESRQFQDQQMQRSSRGQIYKVKKGDTLSSIAKKYHTTVDKLCKLNNISKNKVLRLGQIIKCS
ncbi:MAG: LysM peptidoglycan-binding domain-containing protein, partial [Prevotellaceae bacterium]|nr:LysM peptidoglycan-binding domain-containing protein [Prevotellaceae bacterium]